MDQYSSMLAAESLSSINSTLKDLLEVQKKNVAAKEKIKALKSKYTRIINSSDNLTERGEAWAKISVLDELEQML